jgi:hypothetical protein
MPLASTFALQFFGPACAAMVVDDAQGTLHEATPHRQIRPALAVEGIGSAVLLRPYRGRNAAVQGTGIGAAVIQPRKNIRTGLSVLVSELSQDDVTGAVLEAPIEGTLTLKQVLRLLLAANTGKSTGFGGGGSVTFRDQADTKPRITGTLDASGNRTAVTLDPA